MNVPVNEQETRNNVRPIDAYIVSNILTTIIEEQKKSHHVDEVIGLMEARTEVNNAPTLDVNCA